VFNSTGEAGSGCIVIQTYRHISGLPYSDITGLIIKENVFKATEDALYVGVFINHDATGKKKVVVKENEFDGTMFYAIVTERNNTVIKENKMVQATTGTGSAIVVMDWDELPQEKVIVKENEIEGFDRGIVIGHSSLTQKLSKIIVKENELKENNIGIQLRGNRVLVKENEVCESTTTGILVLANHSRLKENKVCENGGDGIVVEGDNNSLKENEAEENGLNGFLVTGNMNLLKENESKDNGKYGFNIEGDNNVLIENKAEDNVSGPYYDSGAGNIFIDNEPPFP
jgi:parallel beta-helix repeat protein